MGLKRFAILVFTGLTVMACGAVPPTAATSPAPSPAATPAQSPEPTPTPQQQPSPSPSPKASPKVSPRPSPSPQPTSVAPAATIKCSGGPGTTMVVVAHSFLYDVADPINPRLVCRGNETFMHLLDGNAIAYSTVAAGKVVLVRRDLTTGAESRIAQLRVAPLPFYYWRAGWTWDGALEVYATYSKEDANLHSLVSVHLWSNGADHVLYTIDSGPGGLESRWSPRPILEFSPDNTYVAISDFDFAIYGSKVRVFSIADRRQNFVVASSASGGTWIPKGFVWADMSGALTLWAPSVGTRLLRTESWFGVTKSSDMQWLAGTQLDATTGAPHVFIAPLGAGQIFRTGPASSPGFVTPTVVWYAEEGPDTSGGFSCAEPCNLPTLPNGVVHALDVVTQTDRIVQFHTGQTMKLANGAFVCCETD